MESTRTPSQGDLRETVQVLRRRWTTVALALVFVPVAALGYSLTVEPVYRSTAVVVIRPLLSPAAFQGSSVSGLGLEISSQDEAQIAMSAAVTDRIASVDPGSTLEVQAQSEHLLSFAVESSAPDVAASLANEHAGSYIAYRREITERSLKELLDGWDTQIRRLSAEMASIDREIISTTVASTRADSPSRRARLAAELTHLNAQRNDKTSRLNQLRSRSEDAKAALGQSSGGGEVVHPAAVAEAPVRPNPIRSSVIGLVFGLFIGVAVAFLRDHLDGRVRSVADVASAASVPVLAAIPKSRVWRRKGDAVIDSLAQPDGPVAESFRALREALLTFGVGTNARTVVVTSGGSRAGKSAVAANLAVQLGRSGRRVALISADLRRPRLHVFFDAEASPGLAEVVCGDASFEDVARPVGPGVTFVPAGEASSATEVIDSPFLAATLGTIGATADVVIIDAPPLSAGADAGSLARLADVTLVVARRGKATRAGVSGAVTELRRLGARSIALVVSCTDGVYSAYGASHGEDGPRTGALAPEAPATPPLGSEPPRTHAPRKPARRAAKAKVVAKE